MGDFMSSVIISGDTSGAITLAAPSVAGTNTITLPANTGTVITTASSGQIIPLAALPVGTVLQVKASPLTTTVSNNGSAWADTGLTVTITPSASTSKFLIQWAIPNGNATNIASVGFNLVRNGTNIAQGTGGTTNITSSNDSGGNSHAGVNSLVYLDSPATSSAIIYKVQFKAQSGTTGYINQTVALNGGTDVYQSGFISNLVVMEISGS
jgi:hypothetical protein